MLRTCIYIVHTREWRKRWKSGKENKTKKAIVHKRAFSLKKASKHLLIQIYKRLNLFAPFLISPVLSYSLTWPRLGRRYYVDDDDVVARPSKFWRKRRNILRSEKTTHHRPECPVVQHRQPTQSNVHPESPGERKKMKKKYFGYLSSL